MSHEFLSESTSINEWGWEVVTELWWYDDPSMFNWRDYEYEKTYILVPLELSSLMWAGGYNHKGRIANPKLEYELLCPVEFFQGQYTELACPLVDAPDIPQIVAGVIGRWKNKGWLSDHTSYNSFINFAPPQFPSESQLDEMGLKELQNTAKKIGAIPTHWGKKATLKDAIIQLRKDILEAEDFYSVWRDKVIKRYQWILECKRIQD